MNQDEISQIKAEEKSKILEYRKLKKKKKYENRKQYELESEEIEFEPAYIDDKEEIHIEMASIPNEK